MTIAQLTVFFIVLLIWVIYALELLPFLQGRRLRREVEIIGWVLLAALLVYSLVYTPSYILWAIYAGATLFIALILWLYNRWGVRQARREGV